MSYTVIFMEGKGVSRLGQFNDKGGCRRAWRTCSQGAAIVGPDGSVLEFRSGTTQPSERALKAYAEHMKRPGGTGGAAPAPEPSRATVKVERVELEVEEEVEREPEEDDDEGDVLDEEPTAPPPAPRPAEVTHALDPATGAVVQGDDTERLQPPAAPARCGTAGCDHAPGIDRKNVLPAWRPFCGACRVVIRQRSRSMPGGVAAVIAHLRAGTLPPPSARHVAIGARGGKSPRRPPPAARRVADPASTLAAGLERVKRHAAVVDALGGVEVAEQLAAVVRDAGGVNVVVEALTELRSVA